MQVAQTILGQLGGNKFQIMTGASNFVALKNGLVFKLPSRLAKDGINCIRVVLNDSDTYDIEFMRIWGINSWTVETVEVVYNDQLRQIISERTGLELTMPTITRS